MSDHDAIRLYVNRQTSTRLPDADDLAALLADRDALVAKHDDLTRQIRGLEALRPVWAQGWTSDSGAAQASAAALSQLWKKLGATSQTEAAQKLEALARNLAAARELLRELWAAYDPLSRDRIYTAARAGEVMAMHNRIHAFLAATPERPPAHPEWTVCPRCENKIAACDCATPEREP